MSNATTSKTKKGDVISEGKALPIIVTKVKKKELLSRVVVLEARIQELIMRVRRLESPGEDIE